MREIKFRAWVKGNMYYNHSVSIGLKGGIHFLQPDGEWEVDLYKEVTLMQYTGLKDKDGKEIYEGDIVKLPSSNGTPNQMAMGIIIENKACFYIEFVVERRASSFLFYHHSHCEIIGNIYETPFTVK